MAEQARVPEGVPAAISVGPHEVTHIVPGWVLLTIWLLLIVLTVATVSVAYVDFGANINLWIAMSIATAKASLVLLYFMHLRYDSPLNALWFIFALFFVALFIGATIGDSRQYQGELIPGYAPAMNR